MRVYFFQLLWEFVFLCFFCFQVLVRCLALLSLIDFLWRVLFCFASCEEERDWKREGENLGRSTQGAWEQSCKEVSVVSIRRALCEKPFWGFITFVGFGDSASARAFRSIASTFRIEDSIFGQSVSALRASLNSAFGSVFGAPASSSFGVFSRRWILQHHA